MPYIDQDKRDEFAQAGIERVAKCISTTGQLNYAISYLAKMCVDSLPKKSYADLSAIRASMLDAADEFYRRVLVPYENEAIERNGDIY